MITDKDKIRINAYDIITILTILSNRLKFFKVDGQFLQDPLDENDLENMITLGDAVEKALQYAKNIQKITH